MNAALSWLFAGQHAAAAAGGLSLACFLAAWHLVARGGAVPKRI
jgi:hypothetical protein